jgi:hypothetical protein
VLLSFNEFKIISLPSDPKLHSFFFFLFKIIYLFKIYYKYSNFQLNFVLKVKRFVLHLGFNYFFLKIIKNLNKYPSTSRILSIIILLFLLIIL